MPYITKGDRQELDDYLEPLIYVLDHMTAGDLTYVLYKLVKEWVAVDKNYSRIARAVGILNCTAMEYYRREAVPYEDQKIKENGDV